METSGNSCVYDYCAFTKGYILLSLEVITISDCLINCYLSFSRISGEYNSETALSSTWKQSQRVRSS